MNVPATQQLPANDLGVGLAFAFGLIPVIAIVLHGISG
jgi:hypothetical protein